MSRQRHIELRLRRRLRLTDVEDGGRPGELASRQFHSFVHAEHLGIVERSFVEVLQSLRDEEEGQEEPIDPSDDRLVLFRRLSDDANRVSDPTSTPGEGPRSLTISACCCDLWYSAAPMLSSSSSLIASS